MSGVRADRGADTTRMLLKAAFSKKLSPERKRIATEVARVALQQPDAPRKRGAGQPITKRFYPALVMLKLAGRSPREIAEIFGQSTERVQGHLSRAMNEYRQGKIEVNGGDSVSEARSKGKEDSVEAIDEGFKLSEEASEDVVSSIERALDIASQAKSTPTEVSPQAQQYTASAQVTIPAPSVPVFAPSLSVAA